MKTLPKTENHVSALRFADSECLRTKIASFQRTFAIFRKPESENCPGGWQAALAAGPGLAYPWQLARTTGQQAANPHSQFNENNTKTVRKQQKMVAPSQPGPKKNNFPKG